MDHKKKLALVFDCDGVVYDSCALAHENLNKILGTYGMPPVTLEIYREKLSDWNAIEMFRNAGVPDPVEAAHRNMDLEATSPKAPLMLNVEETLKSFQERNIPVHIVSARRTEILEALLAHLGILSYVTSLQGGLDAGGKTEFLKNILRGNPLLKPDDIIFVDDMGMVLAEVIKSIGCWTVWSANGYSTYDRVSHLPIDYKLYSFDHFKLQVYRIWDATEEKTRTREEVLS